jgi:hypothetical protein
MSAYVNRLIQRFAPAGEPAIGDPSLNPFVRSQSPIAEVDQRLGVDEQLGHGVDGVEPTADQMPESPFDATEPAAATIQRKVVGPSPVSPTQPNVAPKPSLEPSNPPSAAFEPLQGPQPSPAADAPEVSKPRSSKPPPLDPGPLFDPVPRYFDEARAPAMLAPIGPTAPVHSEVVSTSITEIRTIETAARLEAARQPSVTSIELRPRPLARTIEPRFAWFESPTASVAPQQLPDSVEPERAPNPTVQLYIVPRPRTPEPVVPEPVEYPHLEGPTSAPIRQSTAPAPSTRRSTSSPVAQATRHNPGGKLTIDTISVIGPLDRHFPDRRSFRLRYR